uniref:Uncharacterized protein n=1 Tax=Nelumbo nucifera TaxID=4432 RepID=A0A822ZBX7_NELNU|nr:TPA_asm: hypothetical protein HUJ06_000862 [Nelumbo nucifera]
MASRNEEKQLETKGKEGKKLGQRD